MGGLPARIRMRLFPLRPRQAAHGGGGVAPEEGIVTADALAEACRAAMQRQLDAVVAECDAERAGHPAAAAKEEEAAAARASRGGGSGDGAERAPLLVPQGAHRSGGSSDAEDCDDAARS